jgi:hypothetical protein
MHATKVYKASERITLFMFNQRTKQKCAVNFKPQSLYPSGKIPQYPSNMKLKIHAEKRCTSIYGQRPNRPQTDKRGIVRRDTKEVTYSPCKVSSR